MTLIEILRTHDPSKHPDCHEAAGLLEKMEWRPIETAPWDDTPILVYRPGDTRTGLPLMIAAATCKGSPPLENYWSPVGAHGYDMESTIYKPTHWMPLPEPPNTLPDSGEA